MARKIIDLGTPPEALDGDTVRAAFTKINDNFEELYGQSTSLVEHNDLGALQGGKEGERFHLTGVEHLMVQNLGDASQMDVGTTEGTVASGGDPRLDQGLQAFEWGDHTLEDYAKNSDVADLTKRVRRKQESGATGAQLSLFLSNIPTGEGTSVRLVDSVYDPNYPSSSVSMESPQISSQLQVGEFVFTYSGEKIPLESATVVLSFMASLSNDNTSEASLKCELWVSSTKVGESPWSEPLQSSESLPVLLSCPVFGVEMESGSKVELKVFAKKLGEGSNPRVQIRLGGSNPAVLSIPVSLSALLGMLSTVASTGEYEDLEGKPELSPVAFTGNYGDLVGTPSASGLSYNDLEDLPDLSEVAYSGKYSDLKDTPANVNPLDREDVINADPTTSGTVTGEDVHAGAEAWFSKPVLAEEGSEAGKTSTIGFDGGVLGNDLKVCAFRASTMATGRSNPGGWIAGLDTNVTAYGTATADKAYGVGAYFQVGENAAVDKILGFEPVLNRIDPTAVVENFVGFYFPNLAVVPNIGRVSNLACFASDMPGADMRIRGDYVRIDDDGMVNELTPGPLAHHTEGVQWVLGRVGYADKGQQELPPGAIAVGVIYLSRRCRLTELGVFLETGTQGTGKLALYRPSHRGLLGQKLWESDNFQTEGRGNKLRHPNLPLPSGMYLTTFISNSPQGIRITPNSMANNLFGTQGADSDECIPFFYMEGFPETMPENLSWVQPAGYVGTSMADFNFRVTY